jgi:hypothetical protein
VNAAQRRPYLAAVEQQAPGLTLCDMCRHFWRGPASEEGTRVIGCHHPLRTWVDFALVRTGRDCPSFRPTKEAREEIAYDGQYHTTEGPTP